MPKIVILRGRPASGKSTAFAKLKKRKEFDGWVLIDNCELKSWFNYLEENKEIKKKALFALMKEVMKKKKNILNQMDSEDTRKACVIDAPTSKEIYNCVRDSESGKLTKSYKNKASKETLESSKVPSMKCGVGRCGGSM